MSNPPRLLSPGTRPFPHRPPSTMSSSSSISINPSDLIISEVICSTSSKSTVYLVKHQLTNQQYALKIINGSHDETARYRISREIGILRATDNPFIIQYHGHFEDQGNTHILLEYMDRTHIGSLGCIDEETLAEIAYQILQGVAYLHSKKIVHRNINPLNVLINSQWKVKIADFGLSWVMDGETRIFTAPVGTSMYDCDDTEPINEDTPNKYNDDIFNVGTTILECHVDPATIEVPSDASEDFASFIDCCRKIPPSQLWTAEQLLGHSFITKRYDDNTPASSSASSSSTVHE